MLWRITFEKNETLHYKQSLVVEVPEGLSLDDLEEFGLEEHLHPDHWEYDGEGYEIERLGTEETEDQADHVLVRDKDGNINIRDALLKID